VSRYDRPFRGPAQPGRPAAATRPGRILGDCDAVADADPDISPEELREFLSADFLETDADPIFKEALREKLWTLVRSGAFGYGKGRPGRD